MVNHPTPRPKKKNQQQKPQKEGSGEKNAKIKVDRSSYSHITYHAYKVIDTTAFSTIPISNSFHRSSILISQQGLDNNKTKHQSFCPWYRLTLNQVQV